MILVLPWIPLATAFVMLFAPKDRTAVLERLLLLATGTCFAITIYLFLNFQAGGPQFQFVRRFYWVPYLGISYHVGVDGISMTMCLLHAFVSFAGAITACSVKERSKEYFFFYLILVGSIYGVFTNLDLFFMYLFYEMTLIPLFPMIGIWGSKNKEYGAMKLTIFITTGAVIAFFGILLLYRTVGMLNFDFIQIGEMLRRAPMQESVQKFIVPFLLIGFGVIASLWPLHSWSPIGYAVAPTSVSMLHAGVLKKMGPYLILRLAVTLLPAGTVFWTPYLAVLSGIGILYAGYAAIWQKDLKYMVGFSSVSHMGYVLLGISALTPTALAGTVLLMFSHGVMAACSFAVIGFLYDQTHVREVTDFGGLAKKVPFISICFILSALASAGLPGFSNFPAELLIFIGSWRRYPGLVTIAVFGVLITAIYLLRAVQKVCYGPLNPRWNELQDAKGMFQKLPFILLLGALFLFGFWPNGLLHIIRPAVEAILQ